MSPATLPCLLISLLFASLLPLVRAEIFVVKPSAGSTCKAGQSCTVQWVDDGVSPTLSTVGICNVGLYHGEMQLVQALQPIDVSATQSFTFTPQANAGPNSASYYIAFISTSATVGQNQPYMGFSPFFTLSGMTGSFSDPVASLTSAVSVPASVSTQTDNAPLPVSTLAHTITVSVSSATATAPAGSTASGFSTSRAASSTSSSSAPASSTSASRGSASAANARPHTALAPLFILTLAVPALLLL